MSRAANPQLCVDFVDTVDWRNDAARIDEQLKSFDDLVKWAQQHEVVSDAIARRLQRSAREHPRVAGQVLDRSLSLRDAIYRVLSNTAAEQPVPSQYLDRITEECALFAAQLRLRRTGGTFNWEWSGEADALDRLLWPVLQSTVELLTSPLLSRIRECEGPGCGWIILDNTKNRSKRWCSMETCGNRAKVKRFYERHKQETTAQ